MTKFLKNISVESEGHIQFKTVDGTNAGKIDQDGNDLVLTNAVGDVLLGDGDSDVYIGNGSDNVDILFEQSGNIKADDSASGVTLTLGSSNTTLNLESPNVNGNLSIGLTSISNKLTFTGNDGYILFDREPSNYDGTTSIPLLKVDQAGTEKTILERISANGGILLGADDNVIIAGGDTRNVLRTNLNETGENVVIASESGFVAYGFPGNDTSWANRNEFKFRSDSSTASENGLYIGDGGSSQFIDLSKNLTVGTINSGAITSTGKIQGTELEGTSLDINGNADIAGVTLLQASTGGNSATTLIPLDSSGNSQLKIKGGNYIHTIAFETSWNDFEYAKLTGGYNTGDSSFNINKSNASGAIDATTKISTGDSFFAGNVGIGTTSPLGKLQVNDYTVASQGNQAVHGEVSIFANSGNESLFLGIRDAAYPNRGWALNTITNGVNSDLQIKEHGSTGVRMTIQTGGNVGIGTTSPDSPLHIEKTDTAYDVARGIHVDYTKNHTNTTGWGASLFGVRSNVYNDGVGKLTDLQAGRFVSEHIGTGISYYLLGSQSKGVHNGSGNTGVIWGAFNAGQILGTGTGTHPFLIGTNQKAELNNANATVANMAGIVSAAKTTAGTVTGRIDAAWLELDCNQGAATTVDANILYLKSDTGNLTVSGTARSIYSNSTLPSLFAGSIESPKFFIGTSEANYLEEDGNGVTRLYGDGGIMIETSDGLEIDISDTFSVNGDVIANSLIKDGGTSSQFLKADGSVDSTVYTGDQDLSGYVTTNTTQTISGAKLFNNDVALNQTDLLAVATGYFSQISIGATSPSALFHIIDNTEQSQVRIGSDTSNYLSIDVAGDGDSTISAIGSGFLPPDINFNTNSTTVLKVSGTFGYVGIGTVTPSERLEVNGNVQAETLIATDLADGYVPYNRNGTLGLQDSSIYQDSGNVGIGTTTLSQALNVNGNILATGYRVSAMQTAPSSRSDTGTLGEIRITADYIYVCYATNSWRRVAISAW